MLCHPAQVTLRRLVPAVVCVLALTGCDGDGETLVSSPPATVTATVTATATATATATGTPTAGPTAEVSADVDLSQPPTTYDEAVAHVDAGADRGSLESFVTPSGNIFCALTVQDLPTGCEIGGGATADPAVCTEPSISRSVGRIELVAGVAVAVCNTDTIRTSDPAAVLGYGESVTTRDTRCTSEEVGVTCVARSGAGAFFLRRGQYAVLNP